MNFKDFYFGNRDLLSSEEIIEYLKRKFHDEFDKTKSVLLYKSPKRRSWLVFGHENVYKVLDNKEEDRPIINWKLDNKNFKNHIGSIKYVFDEKPNKVIFPNKASKKYLFDSNLFQNMDLKDYLEKYIYGKNKG